MAAGPSPGRTSRISRGLVAFLAAALGCLSLLVGRAAAAPGTFFAAPASGQAATVPPGADPADPVDVASTWAERNSARTGLTRADADLELTDVERAGSGVRVVRMQQEVDGIPVLAGETVVAVDRRGGVVSATGERLTGPTPDLRPAIPAAVARATAVRDAAKAAGLTMWDLRAGPATKVIFQPSLLGAPSPEAAYLAWQVDVSSVDGSIEEIVLVHADRGHSTIIPKYANALSRAICNGNQQFDFKLPCTPATATRADGGVSDLTDAMVNNAWDYIGDTWSYFSTRFGRDSYDNQGSQIRVTVRACITGKGCPLANAYWSNGNYMTLGTNYVVDDIVAHEFTHGVTNATADLYYYFQSGAINEAMSDIFGEFVDLGNGRGDDSAAARWKMGEDRSVVGHTRYMKDPPAKSHPDRTGSALYNPDDAIADSGGVHTNSGVANKAAFLLTDGGTFNGRTISALGQSKVEQIFYRTLTTGLRSGSDYQDLRAALNAACSGLIGQFSITAANCAQVDSATLATEMNLVPALAPGAEADVCPVGQKPAYQVSDDMESWDGSRWDYATLAGTPNVARANWYAASGTRSFWMEATAPASDYVLILNVGGSGLTIPANSYLRFDHAYSMESGVDGAVVEYQVKTGGSWPATWTSAMGLVDSGYAPGAISAGGTALQGRAAFTGLSRGWGSSRINLASLANQTVRFRFRMVSDATTSGFGWYLDDFGVYNCGVGDETPPETTITSGPSPSINTTSTSVAFSSSEANSTFQCSLDGAAFALCRSAVPLSGLAAGSHDFLVRAIDPTGNVDPTPAGVTFTVDRTAPDTAITSAPGVATNSTTLTYTFTSPDATAVFECALDSGAWVACTSPHSFTGVSQGTHTLRVRAIDPATNADATPAATTTRVDTVAPTTVISSGPGTYINTRNTSVFMTSNEVSTGVTFACRLDGGGWVTPCSSPVSYSNLPAGAHTITVKATDVAGNAGPEASRSFTVDLTAPDTTITSGPGSWINVSSASVGFSSTEAGGTFQCAIGAADFGACSSPKLYAALVDGAYIVRVRAVDLAGNVDPTPATRNFSVDTISPDMQLISGPPAVIATTTATFDFDAYDVNLNVLECAMDDDNAWTPCTSPKNYTGLGEGSHRFGGRAVDLAQNRTPVWVNFVVDTIAPTATITSGPAALTNSLEATIAFTSNQAGSSFECKLDDDDWIGCSSPATFEDLAEGAHTFLVRATDLAGNTQGGAGTARAFTVDATSPNTNVTSQPDPSILASTATITMEANEPVSRFECSRNGAAFATCSSPATFSALALGDHEVQVRAVDLAGNIEEWPQSVFFTREASPPADDEPSGGGGDAGGGGGDGGTPGQDDGGTAGERATGSSGAAAVGSTGARAAGGGLAAALARAKADLTRRLAACPKSGAAATRCRARAQADYTYAVAAARATDTRDKALAACAKRPPSARAACSRTARAAYASAMRRAATAKATALRRAR